MRMRLGQGCVLLLALASAACGGNDGGGGGGTGGTGGGGTGGTGGGGGTGGTGGSGGGGGTTALACSTGTLFAGNPTYNGDPLDRPTSGTGIHADPPLQWENLIFSGTQLYTRSEGEIWGVDLSAANPVETLIAGKNSDTTFAFNDGACASARFAQVRGIDTLADGSIVVADHVGQRHLAHHQPDDASCAVEYWAGNNTPNADVDITNPPDDGDMDGDGAAAKFSEPRALVSDGANFVYVFDSGNHKIKKVGVAAPHTVTTLATLPAAGPDNLTNLTRMGTKLYAAGSTGAAAFVISIDTTNGNVATLVSGAGDAFPPLDSHTFPTVAGITNDGTNLWIAGSGYLWKLTTAGVLTLGAGTGVNIDFPPDASYDPAASHSADTLDLEASQGSAETGTGSLYYVTYKDGAVYFRGHGDGTAAFIEKVTCQ